MLKTTKLPNEPTSSKNNGSKLASSKNNNNKPTFEKNNGDNVVNKFGDSGDGIKYTKKSGKLKGQKLTKSQKSAKLGKKSSKSGNLPNFDAKKNRPSFLTLGVKKTFNHLWLVFIKTPIFWHFDPECHI